MNFNSIKEGDEIIVNPSYGLPIQLHTVCRTTKTQIIVGQWRFRRSNGYRIGDSSFHQAVLLHPTPELRERIARIALIRFILDNPYKLDHVPMESLQNLVGAMKRVTLLKPLAA